MTNLETLKGILDAARSAHNKAFANWVSIPGYEGGAKEIYEATRETMVLAESAHWMEYIRVAAKEQEAA